VISREFKRGYIFRFYNKQIKRQLDKTHVTDDVEQVAQHQLEERTSLQQILCDFLTDLDIRNIIYRKICAINLMVALTFRQETQRQRTSLACEAPVKEESVENRSCEA
jgi:hypothetical protein